MRSQVGWEAGWCLLSRGRGFQMEEGHPSAAWRTGAWEREAVWTGLQAGLRGQRPGIVRRETSEAAECWWDRGGWAGAQRDASEGPSIPARLR